MSRYLHTYQLITSFVFTASTQRRFSVDDRYYQRYGTAAHRTVLDVFLIFDAEVDDYLDAFSATGAVEATGLSVEIQQVLPSGGVLKSAGFSAPYRQVAVSP